MWGSDVFAMALCAEFGGEGGEGGDDYFIHVVVLVLSESAAEYNIGTGGGKGFVLFVKGVVCGIVYRIVRLGVGVPLSRIFTADHRFFLLAEFKMLVPDNSCVRNFPIGVVHYGVMRRTRRLRR